jgi:MYXO-CTERM domain-containing protein
MGFAQSEPVPLPVCAPSFATTPEFYRLSPIQYQNTVRDLLSLDAPLDLLAPPRSGDITDTEWEGYRAAARALSAALLADQELRASVLPCFEDTPECVERIAREFGFRAYRRPLRDDEVADFLALADDRATLTADGTFEQAVELMVETFLGSIDFVTRAEAGHVPDTNGNVVFDDYEMASRLSYVLWETMPDQELFAAAAAGELHEPDQVLAQAERMIDDPRVLRTMAHFHEYYLGMGPGTRWQQITHQSELFPLYDDAMVPAMLEETERVFDDVVRSGGTFADLLLTPRGFVNQQTAPLYGLDPAGVGPDLTSVDLGPDRPGVFTRLLFLSAYSHPDRTAPILRGAFLLKQVECVDVGAPLPEGVGTPLPTDASLVTNRQRTEAQTESVECLTCHGPFINPLGFALESFDAVGELQSTDNGEPVDTQATVMVYPDEVDVASATELMQALADAPGPALCYATQWVRYAFSLDSGAHSCLAEKLARVLDNGSLLDMVLETTRSEWFLGTTPDAPMAPPGDSTPASDDDSPATPPRTTPQSDAGVTSALPDAGASDQNGGTGPSKPVVDGSAPDDKAEPGPRVAEDAGNRASPAADAASPIPAADAGSGGVDSRHVAVSPGTAEHGCACRAEGGGSPREGSAWLLLTLGLAVGRRFRRAQRAG